MEAPRRQRGDRRGRQDRWSRRARAGFDTAGDSIWLPSKGKVTFKVTAKEGSTLAFVCAMHPWMLGEIKVK